jgi:hypothetical protein
MRTIPTLALFLFAAAAAAADRGELPLQVLTGGIAKGPGPALAVGGFAGGFGIRDQPDQTLAQWLPEIRRYDRSVSEVFGKLAPVPTDGQLLVIAALPMPWRPTAVEREGARIVIRGDGIEPADATPELTGEPAEALRATHEFALTLPRAGVETVRLEVTRHAKVADLPFLRAIGPIEAAVDLAAGKTTAEARAASEVIAAPGAWNWQPPRVIVREYGGGDHEEGLAGVGVVDTRTESKERPLVPHPPAPGDQVDAVVVTPVLQTGEWAQLRSVGWALGVCHLSVAVFHDNGERSKNIPHRDALIARVLDHAPADGKLPAVVVHFDPLIAADLGGPYRQQHVRDAAPVVKDAAAPAESMPKPTTDF